MIAAPLAASVFVAVLIACAGAAALFALSTRALFAAVAACASMSALAAVACLLAGGGDAALALAAFGVGLAPVVLIGCVLLTARAAKPGRGRALWFGGGVAIAALALTAFFAPEFAEPARMARPDIGAPGLWLAGLVFVAIVGGVGLLGYGPRGILGQRADSGS